MKRIRASATSERVVIVGGGLVGCVLAIYLSRRGIGVTIYERNADERCEGRIRRPSLSLSLCTRGCRSLARVDLMPRLGKLLAPAFGRMIHAMDGTASYQPYSAFGEAIHCVSRRDLGLALLDAVEEAGVEIQFERRCVQVDAASGAIALEDSHGARTHDRANAIIAADGCFSAVRRQLRQDGLCRFTQSISDEGYVEFRISAEQAAAAGLRRDVLHGWPRPGLIAGAFPEPDGSFGGTLHMPLAGPQSFDTLWGRRAIDALLDRECPDLARVVPDLADRVSGQRPNSLVTVTCTPWSAGKVLLIGDAAHAMLPYYGQGANAGFEDCQILDGLIERHGTDWPFVFGAFERTRKHDTDAMADLCREHLAVLRDHVTEPAFQARWTLEQRLHCLVPESFTPLYSMIAFSSIRYAEARLRDRVQSEVLQELLRDSNWRIDAPGAAERLRRGFRERLDAVRHTSAPRGQEDACLVRAASR